jgi:hypothetical protein
MLFTYYWLLIHRESQTHARPFGSARVLSTRPAARFLFRSASLDANSAVTGLGMSSFTSFSDLRTSGREPTRLSSSSWPPPRACLTCGVAVAVWGAPPLSCRCLLRSRQGGGSHQESWGSHGISSLRLFLTFVRSQCYVILDEKKNFLLCSSICIGVSVYSCMYLKPVVC